MSSQEGIQVCETQKSEVFDIPRSHWEGLDKTQLEQMSLQDASLEIGKQYFTEDIENSPGTLQAFQALEKDGGAEQFAKYYSNYISMPKIMSLQNPQMYAFMRDRVFFGKEYEYKTYSPAFNMVFPYSAEEGRVLRKEVSENHNLASPAIGNPGSTIPDKR